jgi:hypothetical protein
MGIGMGWKQKEKRIGNRREKIWGRRIFWNEL